MRTTAEARTVAAVVNTGSRRGAKAYRTVVARLRQLGLPLVEVHAVTSGTELAATLDDVLSRQPDLLVVGGGDGTVSCAAGRTAGTETVLAVLPLGTANDLARTLAIPGDPTAAVDALVAGKVVDIDLGRAGTSRFLNVASVGLSVGVTEALGHRSKRLLGPMAYPVATLRAYRRHRPFRARLDFPDGDHDPLELDDLLQVAIGNGRHYGGGNAVSPTAGIDDHTLDVYAIVQGRLRDHVSIARLLQDGRLVEHERVHHLTTRRLRLTTEPGQAVNLDGEIAARTPTDFAVERNAVHVVVPVTSAAATLDRPRRSVGGP